MNAKETLIQYAEQTIAKYAVSGYTPQEFMGKAMQGGICVKRDTASKIVIKMSKTGTNIVVTEVTTTKTNEVVNGKVVFGETTTSVEALTVSLV